MFWLTISLMVGIFLSNACCGGILPEAMAYCLEALTVGLLVGMFVAHRKQGYAFRWLFGGMAFLFMACIGALLLHSKCLTVAYDWPSERTAWQGTILETPQEKPKTYLCKLRVEFGFSAQDKAIPVNRTVWAYIMKDSLSARLQCGEGIRFFTRISRPSGPGIPGDFDYATYLFHQQVSGTAVVYSGHWQLTGKRTPLTLKQKASEYRQKILRRYQQWGFSDDERALLSALTVGYRNDLNENLQETYRTAGVAHLLALSGMHVAILWGLLHWLMDPLERFQMSRRIKGLLIILSLWGFAFLVGLSPSVVRAVIMCTLMTITRIAGGRVLSLNSLTVAAFFMLAYNPFYLFDIGFQLSFLATFSIIALYPYLSRYFVKRHPILRFLWGIIALSLVAQAGTAPLSIYYFSRFPVHFLWANLLAVPLVMSILYGAVAVFALSPFGEIHAWAVKIQNGLLRMLNEGMRYVEHLPMASIEDLHPTKVQVALIYLLGVSCLIRRIRRSRWWLMTLLAWVNLFVGTLCWQAFAQDHEPRLYLTRSQVRTYPQVEVKQQEGIYHYKGIQICLVADNHWKDKETDHPLEIDYLYLCRGYKGRIADLQRLFRIRKVILDTSITEYWLHKWKEECEQLNLEYVDLSEKGVYTIPL